MIYSIVFPHIEAVMSFIRGIWYALPVSISGYIGWYLALSLFIILIHIFKS